MCSITSRVSRSNEQRSINRRWPYSESATEENSLRNNTTNQITCADNQLAQSDMQILYPLSTRKDQLELVYPRRLILGLWRVYDQLVIKMTRLQIAKCKKSFLSSSSQVSKSFSRKSHFPNNSNESLQSNAKPSSSNSSENRCLSFSSNVNNYNNNIIPSDPVNNTCQKSKVTSDFVNNCNWESPSHLSSSRSSPLKSSPLSSSTVSSSSQRRSCHFVKFSMGSWTFLVLFYLLLILGSSVACGPGRSVGRRRAPRKLTPLVFKQHVPNVPENTASASGLTEGQITRDQQKFKNLVPNYNQDIIFRDEEGSGADRLMTHRCKEKLNTLAISVMNQWPGVKLRVTEGWDEERAGHAPNSLHYEGRAVDITTSDKDRSKYGMLARLAVEAGFDWVFYESRHHIHCSVKSDSTQAGRTGGCFSGNSTVETPTGSRKISELVEGDQILSIDSEGKEVFSDVLLFLDRNSSETREFFVLKTASGTEITLTPSHLIYTVQPESLSPDEKFLFSPNSYILQNQTTELFLDKAVISFARDVQNGDWILVKSHNNSYSSGFQEELGEGIFSIEKVIEMEARVETGVYAPLTSTGNLMVDGVLASCYAVIDDQGLAHFAFLPIRLTHNLVRGVTYLWRQFSRFISSSHSSSNLEAPLNNLQSISSAEESTSNEITSSSINRNHDKESFRIMEKSEVPSVVKTPEQGIHWYANSLYSMYIRLQVLRSHHRRYDD